MDKTIRDLVESVKSPSSEIKGLPNWLSEDPHTEHHVVLSSGPYSTQQEGEDELLPIAANLLQRAFHEHHSWQGEWNVPLAQVRERVVDEFVERRTKTIGKFNGEIDRVYMLVNLSPDVCDTFTEAWKTQIVERRLKVLGILLAWLSATLLVGSSYYRSLTVPAIPRWASMLKASILTIAVTGVAGWGLLNFVS
jgi:hypothetical protein